MTVIEGLIVSAFVLAVLVLAFLLWPKCQTCGRRVDTYCDECEDRPGDTEHDGWTDPDA